MEFIEDINAVIANGIVLTAIIYVAINIYISKYHLKVMDKIVYGQVYAEDNYIHKAMRIIDSIGYMTQQRLRGRLPIETQNKIMALDKKFRRPFMIQLGVLIVMVLIVIVIFILEIFFQKP